MIANIEDILKMDDAHRESVEVPEWNKSHISVCSMTALERAEIERRWSKKDATTDPAQFRADVLERCLKTPDGKPLGTSEQIMQLMGKNANAIERLFEAACRVSGFSNRDVENLAKN